MNAPLRSALPCSVPRRVGRVLRAAAAICALLGSPVPAEAEISILTGGSTLQDETLVTRAELDLRLSGDPLDALSNGISLTYAVEMILFRHRRWFVDQKIAQWQFFYELSYHALSGRYVVQVPESPGIVSFRTLSEALEAIGDFSTEWDTAGALPESGRNEYRMRFRVRLDMDSLPVPIRLMSHMRREWRQSSGWQRWLVAP